MDVERRSRHVRGQPAGAYLLAALEDGRDHGRIAPGVSKREKTRLDLRRYIGSQCHCRDLIPAADK